MNNQTLNEINKRDIDKCYFSISFYHSTIYFNDGNDYIYKRKVYTLIGCNIYGVRKYITSVFEDEYSQASNWYDLFQTLKSKGLETVFFSVIPDNDYLKKAFKLSFPEVTLFITYLDIIEKLFRFFSEKYSSSLVSSIRSLYIAQDINEFDFKVNEFYNDYNVQPFVKEITKSHLTNIRKTFDFDFILRKHIYSFYFGRDFYKKLSKISHNKSYFFDLNTFLEGLLPIIKSMETRMYCPKQEWNQVINSLYKLNKDLTMRCL